MNTKQLTYVFNYKIISIYFNNNCNKKIKTFVPHFDIYLGSRFVRVEMCIGVVPSFSNANSGMFLVGVLCQR